MFWRCGYHVAWWRVCAPSGVFCWSSTSREKDAAVEPVGVGFSLYARVAEAPGDACGGIGVHRNDFSFARDGELEAEQGFDQAVGVAGSLLKEGDQGEGPRSLKDVVDVAVKCGGGLHFSLSD